MTQVSVHMYMISTYRYNIRKASRLSICRDQKSFKMLDGFEILTTSGVVLWSRSYATISTGLINGFINDVLIEEKVVPVGNAAEDGSPTVNAPYKKDNYTLKWISVRDLGLIFVVRVFFPAGTIGGFPGRLTLSCRPFTSRSSIYHGLTSCSKTSESYLWICTETNSKNLILVLLNATLTYTLINN